MPEIVTSLQIPQIKLFYSLLKLRLLSILPLFLSCESFGYSFMEPPAPPPGRVFSQWQPPEGGRHPAFFDVKKGGIRTKGKDSLVQNSLLFVLAAKRSGFYIHTTFHLPNGEKCKQL